MASPSILDPRYLPVVELRPGGSSVKARWVKIELRKIETLPGAGRSNTYVDFVGEYPLTLWQARDEWDEIRPQDLPFQIRLPESIPPSLALEQSAGIKYELVASMLTRGKKGLLGREATPTITASCPIIIDKHELHSAWPLYARPESRSTMLGGYTLTVNRTHQAYGPGDRIAVGTLVKNDSSEVNQIRSYEFSLREHVMYKPPENQNRIRKMMAQPETRTRTLVEHQILLALPYSLSLDIQVEKELSLQVPFRQTITSVTFAHRIEVQFDIRVRVILATGPQLFLDLPITMSNWTRAQSIDIVRRIEHSGTLSNSSGVSGAVGFEQHPMARPPHGNPQPQPSINNHEPTYLNTRAMTAGPPFNPMAPVSFGSSMDQYLWDLLESTLGVLKSARKGARFSPHSKQVGRRAELADWPEKRIPDIFRFWAPEGPISSRPRAAFQGISAYETQDIAATTHGGVLPTKNPPAEKSMSAEEDKIGLLLQQQELYAARLRAEQLQRVATLEAGGSSSMTLKKETSFTEDNEKARRLREVQEAAERSQRLGHMVASSTTMDPSANGPYVWAPERPTGSGPSLPPQEMSAGKALYQSAMASMRQSTLPPGPANGGPGYYPSAAEEKEALRYKRAIELAKRTQADAHGNETAPVSYDALFSSGPSGPSVPPIAPILPLNITPSRSPTNQEHDAYVGNSSSVSPPPPPPESRPLSAREEEERMRQMYEAQDVAARQPDGPTLNGAPLVPPLHSLVNGSTLPTSRTPAPPQPFSRPPTLNQY
ncbi:hypothetical protein FRC00_014681 [Tulasnella sp. 408]|nr:hypothetical protein FRC00_014681 [Tulasnella sp. 408]